MLEYLHERIALRTAVLRVFPSAGPLLLPAVRLQVVGGLASVAFIVTTSAVVGRVPGAVEQGLDSPEWRSLRNVLLIAGGLFVLQQVLGPFQWTCGQMMAWRIDDELRERRGRVVRAGRDRRARGRRDGRYARRSRRPAPRHRLHARLGVLGDAAPPRDLPAVGGRNRTHRRRLCVVGGARARGRRARCAGRDPERLRASRQVRGGVRAATAAARLLPRPDHLGSRGQGDPRLRSAPLAPRPLPRARTRRRPPGVELAAPQHLRRVSPRLADLARARGRHDGRRGARCRVREPDPRRARLRPAGDRARRRARCIHRGGRPRDRARPARVHGPRTAGAPRRDRGVAGRGRPRIPPARRAGRSASSA